MASFEYIDSYFNGEFGPEEQSVFENRITSEPEFAEEVAFYLSSLEAARTELEIEKKTRFREIYKTPQPAKIFPIATLWKFAAAALLIIAIGLVAYNLLAPAANLQQLADLYVNEKLEVMGVTMQGNNDLLQDGKNLYNEGRYSEAQQKFEELLGSAPNSASALQSAGISALRAGDYDKAIVHFTKLQGLPGLRVNYGTFYHGLALLRRDKPGDRKQAKILLNEVFIRELAGKEDAAEFLKHL